MFSSPKICLIDVTCEIAKAIKVNFSDVYIGSLGNVIDTYLREPYQYRKIRVKNILPANLHEYDIFILDMTNGKTVDYQHTDHVFDANKGKELVGIVCKYPQMIFDGRPLTSKEFIGHLVSNEERKLYIIFGSEFEEIHYDVADFSDNGYEILESYNVTNYEFLNDNVEKRNKHGKQINATETEFKNIFSKYIDDSEYNVVFNFNQYQHPNCEPLLVNKSNEIVGYFNTLNDSYFFILPNLKNKSEFLNEFLNQSLPSFIPDFFPENTEAHWINSDDFTLPGIATLQHKKTVLLDELEKSIAELDKEIHEKMIEFQFLHDLIRETSGTLVKSLEKFLNYINFDEVVNVDELNEATIKQEDLRISDNGGLLLVEVKGIGGTSTDDDCSQISKVRYRKMKELKRVDIFALYIVNHQRYLPPPARDNPPFKEIQISDAINDDRGLLTTWELYKAYGYILKGILTKSDIKKQIFQIGLISFLPLANYKNIGNPKEIHKNGYVFILNLSGDILTVGQSILLLQNGDFLFAKIKEIKLDGQNVDTAQSGEFGLRIDSKINITDAIWLHK
jgi:hypothetical protein